ncbi:hypothetical protein EN933_03835 [Mesorhizobium sp. M7A.F.Ca.US.001.01.1.1]|nr:hypothetical protein A9K65_021830 [Mesorhizobium sp. WSM1497]RVA57552.1 hypothetical protein EN933_03835 [Mesorhizobium sp. M7A.F.Ca.US.001.01.1.1]
MAVVAHGLLPGDLPRKPHEPPFFMRFPIQLLVLACLLVGTVPGLTIGPFLHTAVTSVLGPATPQYSLAIWHGFTIPLFMSVLALAGGAILYLLLKDYLARCEDGLPYFRRLRGQRVFERVLVAVSWRGARFIVSVAMDQDHDHRPSISRNTSRARSRARQLRRAGRQVLLHQRLVLTRHRTRGMPREMGKLDCQPRNPDPA